VAARQIVLAPSAQAADVDVRQLLGEDSPPLVLEFGRRDENECASAGSQAVAGCADADERLAGTGDGLDHAAPAGLPPSRKGVALPWAQQSGYVRERGDLLDEKEGGGRCWLSCRRDYRSGFGVRRGRQAPVGVLHDESAATRRRSEQSGLERVDPIPEFVARRSQVVALGAQSPVLGHQTSEDDPWIDEALDVITLLRS
jgi:hypothetical protein